jgi:hypothetical protein
MALLLGAVLSPWPALAQDASEPPRAIEPDETTEQADDAPTDVPTAADEPVLGASPLREEPAPPTTARRSPTEPVLELPVELELFRLPRPPFYETWWFWTAVSAVVIGIVLTVVVAVTTEDDVGRTHMDVGLLRW